MIKHKKKRKELRRKKEERNVELESEKMIIGKKRKLTKEN